MTNNLLEEWNIPVYLNLPGFIAPEISESTSMIRIQVYRGSKLLVVGANGAGKSALMYYLSSRTINKEVIWAHRKNWMQSSTITMSPHDSVQTGEAYLNFQSNRESRYQNPYSEQMIDNALFNLVESGRAFSDKAHSAIDKEYSKGYNKLDYLERTFSKKNSPLGKINAILEHGLLDIQISIGENQIIQASKGGAIYEVSQLSDGERNALILSCQILTSPADQVIFLDEPEQHLHPAIAAPLLSALINERSDCAFAIFTHDISLVEAMPEAKILIVHKCFWMKGVSPAVPGGWDCNFLESNSGISDNVKRAILGGRKRILFIEGKSHSLDRRLYEVIYPDFTVYPIGGCSEVIRAVGGMRDSSSAHWVEAYGIIDNDGRSEEEIQKLKNDNIFVLSELSIESIFYGANARSYIAEKQANELGKNAEQLHTESIDSALSFLSNQGERLSAKRCRSTIRQRTMQDIPDTAWILENKDQQIKISFPSPFSEESERFQMLLIEENLDALIARYLVRESPALDAIAKSLKYQTRKDYESAVIESVKRDKSFHETIRGILPDIGSEPTNA